MQRSLGVLRRGALKIGRRWFLLGGVGLWLFILVLGLRQGWEEEVLSGTPYGDYFLRTFIAPIGILIVFFSVALFRPANAKDSPLRKSLILQGFLIVLVFLMANWALKSLLLANWLVLLGVLLTLPLLYAGGVGIVNPNIFISLGSLVLAFAALELLLHVAPQIWPPFVGDPRSNWGRIHAGIPLRAERTENITYQTNELGFRGTAPVPAQVDLVALGDSFTYGVAAAQPWPERVAQRLGWQALNLGIIGGSPSTLVAPLIEYGLPRRPRVVVYAYFEGNDFYPCDLPARPQGARWSDKLVMPDFWGAIESKIVQWLMPSRITTALNSDVVTPSKVEINSRPVELTFAPAYVTTLTMDRPRLESSENWRIVSQSLMEMHDLAAAQNSEFMLVYIPEITRVYWPYIRQNLDVVKQVYSDKAYQWTSAENCLTLVKNQLTPGAMAFRDGLDATLDEQQKLIADFAARNNIPFLDLTEPLRIYAGTGAVLARPFETHYNDGVNEVMATAIADFITAQVGR